jgi:4-hydroxy-4-methyl-2-oxoglutarate aldolase
MSEIIRDFPRFDAALLAQAAGFQSSVLADVAGRRGGLSSRIAALPGATGFAGNALTVDLRPGDNLMLHAAVALARPGDVLVVDAKGDDRAALMGELMCRRCKIIGIAGAVVDGCVRDAAAIAALGFPVFAAGLSPNGPTKVQPGRINHPVTIGGVVVRPGDLVVGDADGVVIVEREQVHVVLAAAAKKAADEARIASAIESRAALRPGWLEAALRTAGVIAADEAL